MADDKRSVTATKPTNDIALQVAERVRTGDNVLVALSRDPSVDELSAAIGLTFLLDKMGKHATAIFSGAVPNAIEFLEPEKTFEVNTNSLQDFIIALDKDKADHLRYKIDGDYVKVYITPYKTTIDETDLEFSHGDFNVDLVIALGVASAEDLDRALAEHGRIMHDASSINIGTEAPGRFGDLQWSNPAASSVSEMIGGLAERLKDKEVLLDKPIATALLAGIVAATNRFSNERTTPATMTMASRLMEAGADQQLISSSIPVDGTLQVADADTGMPVEEAVEVVEDTRPKEAEPQLAPAVEEVDPSRLEVQHEGAEKVEPVEEQKPEGVAVAEPEGGSAGGETVVEAEPETPEQQLEKMIQGAPVAESTGPLMDELREAAGNQEILEPEREKVLEPLGSTEREPQKDYASLMEQELNAPAPAQVNAATQAAPSVSNAAEINGIPTIDYGQASDVGQEIWAPTMGDATAATETVQATPAATAAPEPVQAAPEPAPTPVVASTPVATPVPMPDTSSEFLPPPPPPPPFEPSMPVGAVDFTPTPPPAPVQEVAPITPAMPEPAPEVEHSYLGSNPAMQDQVYPPASNDLGAFQLPTPSA